MRRRRVPLLAGDLFDTAVSGQLDPDLEALQPESHRAGGLVIRRGKTW